VSCRQRGVSPSSAAWGRWFDLAPGWGPRLRHQSDEPDVAATCWALERKLLADPGHKLGPRNPGSVMPTGLRIRVAAARGMRLAPMPAGSGVAPLADVPDRERELKRREFDDASGPWPRGLPPATPPDPVGRLVPREHVTEEGSAPASRCQGDRGCTCAGTGDGSISRSPSGASSGAWRAVARLNSRGMPRSARP